MAFLHTPGVTGRCDLDPAFHVWVRLRFFIIEVMLILGFVSGAARMSDPWLVTKWLNLWALWAYCSHVAWYRLLPGPLGPMVVYGSAFLFWAFFALGKKHATTKCGVRLPR